VNSEDGNKHPPGPDAVDLDMFVAMITKDEGAALIHVSALVLIAYADNHRACTCMTSSYVISKCTG
jgi:hypothetical protein